MKRFLKLLIGQISKIPSGKWLTDYPTHILTSRLQLNIHQEESLTIESTYGSLVYDYNKLEISQFFSKQFVIIPEGNKNQDSLKLKNLIPHFYDSLIQESIKKLKMPLNSKQDNQPASEQQVRALEWLRVSLTTLSQALDQCEQDSSLRYRGGLFINTRDSDNELSYNLSLLSLNFLFIFHQDSTLQISCWNLKDQSSKENQAPDMNYRFDIFKNQAFDLFIPVLVKVSRISTQYIRS